MRPPKKILNGEEHTADFVDHIQVTSSGSAGIALKGGEHKIRCVEIEYGIDALEITSLGLGFKFAVLYGCTPLASPLSCDMNTKGHIHTFG